MAAQILFKRTATSGATPTTGILSYGEFALRYLKGEEKLFFRNSADEIVSTNLFTDSLLSKLNGIEVGANKYTHPTYTTRSVGGARNFLTGFTSDSLGHVTGISTAAMVKSDIEALLTGTITSHTHTFSSLGSKPTTLSGYGITDSWRTIRGTTVDLSTTTGYYGCMTTTSGITTDWWHVINMDWTGADINNWNSQLALPTQGRNGVYYRSINSANINTASWVKLLDANNYTSYTPSLTGGNASGTWNIGITGNASSASALSQNNSLTYGAHTFQYFYLNGTAGTSVTANNTPTSDYYYMLRMNLNNNGGYFADIATCCNTGNIYWRQVINAINHGWYKILDSNNYSSYALPLMGGTINGNLTVTGNFLSNNGVTCLSDMRYKNVIRNRTFDIEKIANAPLFDYTLKIGNDKSKHTGSSAQYWQKVLPYVVKDNNDMLSMDYATTALASSIMIAAEVISLRKEVKQLKAKINELR